MFQPDDYVNFQCSRLTECKRCSSRREAARTRLGRSPRKTSRSPGPFRRPLPRASSPPPPPCAPCVNKASTNEYPETCDMVSQLLEDFTERVQSLFLALMGFNHPHMERLQAALDQHVVALGRGLMRVMALKDAFSAFRRAINGSQLWKKLRHCHQRLFYCQHQVQAYAATAAEEASLRQESLETSMLLREQAARARSMAAKKLRRGPEAFVKAPWLYVCFNHWGKLTKLRASKRLMVEHEHSCRLHAARACVLQSCFLHWRQSSSNSRRERLLGAKSNAAALAVFAQEQRIKAAVQHVVTNTVHKQNSPGMWKILGRWQLLTLRSHRSRWQERAAAAELAVHQEGALRQRMMQTLSRRCCEGTHQGLLKAALARWMAGACMSATFRRSREGAQKATAWNVSLLLRRQTRCTAWRCLTSWSLHNKIRTLQESLTRLSEQTAPTPRRPASASDRCNVGHAVESEDRTFQRRWESAPGSPRNAQAFPRIFRPSQETSRQTAALLGQYSFSDSPMTSWEVKQHLHAAADAVFQQFGSSTRNASPEAMKHWSLANEASMSEAGYQKLREYHREQARERRKQRSSR
ncbi:unnamed protein product [Symbiodinium necroappetens]|uniref:Sfi1 spindle body domain-containing protein n=1 Tax=Symbiodinium necroappetens TaxID=1628268 RepID=A0A813APR5_9DINO|nr:unnamed protein product [Symbiodinium necroappetens]